MSRTTKGTLYVNNLNEKPSINTTRRELEQKFGKYGDIVSLILKKRVPLKGQLFITFARPESCSKALRELNNSELLGKRIKVSYSKEPSIAFHKNSMNKEQFENFMSTRSKKRNLEEDENTEQGAKKKKSKLIKSSNPNNLLLLQDLSSEITKEQLVEFFSKYKGFIDLRLIKIRKLSFIEFDDIKSAKVVMNDYKDGHIKEFKNDDNESSFITFAK